VDTFNVYSNNNAVPLYYFLHERRKFASTFFSTLKSSGGSGGSGLDNLGGQPRARGSMAVPPLSSYGADPSFSKEGRVTRQGDGSPPVEARYKAPVGGKGSWG